MFLSMPVENLTIGWASIITIIGLGFGVYQYFSKKATEKSAAAEKKQAQEKADIEKKIAQEKADREKAEAVKCAAETVAKTQGREEGTILTQLGAANKGICDIQTEMRRIEDKRETQHLELSNRLTAVEGRASSAHHRIDALEETVNNVKKV